MMAPMTSPKKFVAATAVALGVALGGTVAPLPVAAEPVTVEQANELARYLTETLAKRFRTGDAYDDSDDGSDEDSDDDSDDSAESGASVQWQGSAQAEPEGDGIRLRLPGLVVVNADGSQFAVGSIRLHLTPGAGNTMAVEAILPSSMPMLASDGSPDGELTIGQQHFKGLWSPRLETFLKTDGRLGDVRVRSEKTKAGLALAELTLRSDMTEDPPGRWSGPGALGLRNLRLTGDDGAEVARLGGMDAELRAQGLDLARSADLKRRLDTLTGDEDPVKLRKELLGKLRGLFAGWSFDLAFSDIAVTVPEEKVAFTLGRLGFLWKLEGLDRAASSLSVGFKHEGLTITPPPGPAEFIPQHIELGVSAANLPNEKLWRAFADALNTTALQEMGSAETAFAMGPELLTLLSDAGAELRVEPLSVQTPATSGRLDGTARFDAKAAYGLVADFAMAVRGLDKAVKALQPAAGEKPDRDAQDILAFLGLVQAVGQIGKDADGTEVRNYKVEIGADGKFLLNGADVSALMQTAK